MESRPPERRAAARPRRGEDIVGVTHHPLGYPERIQRHTHRLGARFGRRILHAHQRLKNLLGWCPQETDRITTGRPVTTRPKRAASACRVHIDPQRF